MKQKDRVHQLKKNIPAVFIAFSHKETPIIAKMFALFAIVYALSPIDLIPDFIPILGYLDDIIVLPILIGLSIHFIPKEMFEKYQLEALDLWKDGYPKKWVYAIPFVVVWLAVFLFLIKLFLSFK
jgi:uncharacterized membrane protein YkvA (DUF1232 family)